MGAVLALALAFLAYAGGIYRLGLPDGFISVLQEAQRCLAWVFVAVSLGMALLFAGLALRPASAPWVGGALGAYALMVLAAWGVNGYLVARLMYEGIG